MIYAVAVIAGFVLGALVVFVNLEGRRHKAKSELAKAQQIAEKAEASRRQLAERVSAVTTEITKRKEEAEQILQKATDGAERIRAQAESERVRLRSEQDSLVQAEARLAEARRSVDSRVVAYSELEEENKLLKQHLQSTDTMIRKAQLDRGAQAVALKTIDERSAALAERYLSEVEKWVGQSISANNFAANKQRLVKAIEWSREIGFDVPREKEEALLAQLKADFEMEVRKALEREEQARIKAQIREEQLRQKEIDKELATLERERIAIQAALSKALEEANDAHSDEVDRLKARLAEAEARNQRAIAQAQITKAGHIYIISNIGSFGEGVFKIGMTRRLEPLDRISELSDASVPFPFDVHMMISSDNAPALEHALHKEFHKHRINKVNPRKEYFKAVLDDIKLFVEKHHGEVSYIADAEALEYRQSIVMSEQDQEYIEEVFENAAAAADIPDSED